METVFEFLLIAVMMVDSLLGYPRIPNRYGFGHPRHNIIPGTVVNSNLKHHAPPLEIYSIAAPIIIPVEGKPASFIDESVPLPQMNSAFLKPLPGQKHKVSSIIHFITTGKNSFNGKPFFPNGVHPGTNNFNLNVHLIKGGNPHIVNTVEPNLGVNGIDVNKVKNIAVDLTNPGVGDAANALEGNIGAFSHVVGNRIVNNEVDAVGKTRDGGSNIFDFGVTINKPDSRRVIFIENRTEIPFDANSNVLSISRDNIGVNGPNDITGVHDLSHGVNGPNDNIGVNGPNDVIGVHDLSHGVNGPNDNIGLNGPNNNIGVNGPNDKIGLNDVSHGVNGPSLNDGGIHDHSHGVSGPNNSIGAHDHAHGPNNNMGAHDHAHGPNNNMGAHDHAHGPNNNIGVHDHAHGPNNNIGMHDHSHEFDASLFSDNTLNDGTKIVGIPVAIGKTPLAIVNDINLDTKQTGTGSVKTDLNVINNGDGVVKTDNGVQDTGVVSGVNTIAKANYDPFSNLMTLEPFGPGPYYECRLPSRVVCDARFGWNHVDGMRDWCRQNCVVNSYTSYCDDTRCGCVCKST